MATAAEQWVLVEMVQALYEVSSVARAAHDHTWPWGGGTARVDLWPDTWAGLARSRPDSRRPSLEGLAGRTVFAAGRRTDRRELERRARRVGGRGACSGSCPGVGKGHAGGDTGERLVPNIQRWD